MRSLRSRRSPIACLLLLLYLPACTSMHVVAVPHPAQFVETARPPLIRGTTSNGMTFVLASPVLRGDSLVGTVGSQEASHTIGFPLSEFRSLSIENPYAISWQAGTPTPARYLEMKQPHAIQVRLIDGTKLNFKAPVIHGDSLMGSVWTAGGSPSTGAPLSDVVSVAAPKAAAGKTLLLIAGIVAVPIIAVAIAVSVAPECHTSDCW